MSSQRALLVSVFLLGCLSGGALLTLGENERSESPSPASRQLASLGRARIPAMQATAADPKTAENPAPALPLEPPPPDTEPEEHGRSAADILAELEQAYQAIRSAAALQPKLANAEPASATGLPNEAAAFGSAASEASAPESIAPEPEPAPPQPIADETPSTPEPRQEVLAQIEHGAREPQNPQIGEINIGDTIDQLALQQLSIVNYQPLIIVPATSTPTPTKPPRVTPPRRIGVDPWAPIVMSPRHNPWQTTSITLRGDLQTSGASRRP